MNASGYMWASLLGSPICIAAVCLSSVMAILAFLDAVRLYTWCSSGWEQESLVTPEAGGALDGANCSYGSN